MSSDRYSKAIEQAAGDKPAVPDAKQIVQTTPAPIPRKPARGYKFSNDGLIIQRELSDIDWRDILPEIKAMHSSYQLNYGDWMVYGFDRGYQVSYETMAEMTGLQPQTIEVYTSVCRNVPQLIRINPLKFSHYRLIATMPEDERALWIQFAASHPLSVRALEDCINIATQLQLTAGDAPTLSDDDEDPDDAEIDNIADVVHEKRVASLRKKAAQNRYAEIDTLDIDQIEEWLSSLRKKVKWAKIEADKQARTKKT